MALLQFDETGIVAPDTATIRSAVTADWVEAFNRNDGSPALDTQAATPAGQLIDSETAYIAQGNSELLYLANQFNPLTAEGAFQDALGMIYFITRKVAESTLVDCTCSGLSGTVIPAGSLVQDSNGNRYQLVNAATIGAGGTVTATFASVDKSPIVCNAGTVTTIITVIAGWDSVTNAAAGITGRVAESQYDFEKRRFDSVANNAHGSVSALRGALLAVDGVLDCQVLENDSNSTVTQYGVSVPAHSVVCSVYGGTNADIAETIYNKKSAGCGTSGGTTVTYTDSNTNAVYSYEILRPTTNAFYVTVTLDYYAALPATFISDIQNAIIADFNGSNTDTGNNRIGMAQTVYASRFIPAILKTAGVYSVKLITVSLDGVTYSDSVTIPANMEPTIAAANITVLAL